VFLDVSMVDAGVEDRFPTVSRLCREHGFDLEREPVPVTPAAHYHMGGIVVDAAGRTSIPGLWACGAAARTGLHGANRLDSNSLLEAVVFGAAVGEALARNCRERVHPVRLRNIAGEPRETSAAHPWLEDASPAARETETRLRGLMWAFAGIERDAGSLQRAAGELAEIRASLPRGRCELDNMVQVADLVIQAAVVRTESRGAHCRTDFPIMSGCWQQPLVFEHRSLAAPRPVAAAAVSG